MADGKLRCALVYRIDSGAQVTLLAKYDHAGQYESHSGAADETTLYGGRDQSYAEAVGKVIGNDPPGGLSEAGQIGGFKVVQSDQHQVVYGADKDAICCAVITGTKYPSRIAIQMLTELYNNFISAHGPAARTAAENSLTKKAKPVMQEACRKFEDLSKVDKTAKVLGQVDAVKGQMQDNIANMLKNTEKAESLAEKSSNLNEQASVFKKRSTDLKKQMRWKNLKMTLILGGVVIIILLVVLVPLIVRAKKVAAKEGGN